jgi:hypothetical protein
MYDRLGLEWTSSLLGFISLGCCAIPYIFYFYGAEIRKSSKFAYGGDDFEIQGREDEEFKRARSYVSNP